MTRGIIGCVILLLLLAAVLEDTLLLIVDGSGKVVFVRKERL